MIVDACRGCGLAVWEANIQLARAIIAARVRQRFRVIHGWWNGWRWTDCVKERPLRSGGTAWS